MNVDNRYQNAFAPWHGCSTMTHDELAALRIRAWHEQGMRVVSLLVLGVCTGKRCCEKFTCTGLVGPNGRLDVAIP